jgi:DNA-directed RNA polymerase specialized sigma subunit
MEDENEKDVLTYRYLRGMKWEDIAVKMGYSWRRIHYIHSKALENFRI